MVRNYRTEKMLLEDINKIFINVDKKVECFNYKEKDYIYSLMEKDKENNIEYIDLSDFAEKADFYSKLRDSKDDKESIAVLLRSNNDIREFKEFCDRHEIPCRVEESGGFFRHEAVRDFYVMILALIENSNLTTLYSFIETPYICEKVDKNIILKGTEEEKREYLNSILISKEWDTYKKLVNEKNILNLIDEIINNLNPIRNYYEKTLINAKKSQKKYEPNNVNILFASWNNKEGNAIRERGLEYLLELLKENPNYTLIIPLRDNDTETFNMIAKRIGVSDRVKLLEIHNNTEILTQLFDDSDFVAFVPQKRIVKDVPNSLIDGIVRGKPIIISDVIDFSQEVKKYGIGIVVPGGEKAKKMMIDENTYTELSNRAYEYSARNSNENYLKIIQDSYDMKKKEKKLADRIKVKPIQHNEQLPQKEQERNGVEKDENSNSQYLGDF